MCNDYQKVIKRSEEQFWIEFQTFQVHGIDTRILQKVFSRILSIAPDKRLDFEQNRYPRLHIWIQKKKNPKNPTL